MGLIFVLEYQHHDAGLLNPVLEELLQRGHVIMSRPDSYYGFLSSCGPRMLLLVADLMSFGHAQGMSAVSQAQWKGIKSVSIQHGCPAGFPNADDPPAYTTAGTYCLWGSYWGQFFNSPGQIVTGSPTMDIIADHDFNGAIKKGGDLWGDQPKALLVSALGENVNDRFLADMNAQERAEFFIEKAKDTGWDGLWLVRPHPSYIKWPKLMEAIDYMVRELPAELQLPQDMSLYDVLANCELVIGTSTVIIEALAFGCETIPLQMEYLPQDWRERQEELFGSWPLDGGAASRVADEVERCLKT